MDEKACPKSIIPRASSFSFSQFGFTLIELLVAISITVILFSLGVAQYMKFSRQQVLTQAALELKTNLTQARNLAQSGKKICGGAYDGILVIFDYNNNSYTVYSSCDEQAVLEMIGEPYRFNPAVDLEAGPGNILFKPLVGGTNLDVEQTVFLSSEVVTGDTGVKVTPGGKIEYIAEAGAPSQTPTPTPTPGGSPTPTPSPSPTPTPCAGLYEPCDTDDDCCDPYKCSSWFFTQWCWYW